MNKKTTASRLLKALLAASFLFPAGCSITAPNSEEAQFAKMGEDKFKLKSGNSESVATLREKYLDLYGSELIKPETLSCRWNSKCYFKRWLINYNNGVEEMKAKELADKKKKQLEEQNLRREACMKNPECVRGEKIDSAAQQLNMGYNVLQGMYQYDKGGADTLARMVCRESGKAQRDKVSKEHINEWVNSLDGIPPYVRRYVVQVAESCWDLSSLGISNGTVKLRRY
ncbi:TPA: hypothetical protein ACQFK6_002726 [Proteus mirabilis]|uniref:hypothetical protein n=1 Tax=Proteus TaxID=583 RepID=UPI001376F1C8|nr:MULTISPECIES: hypothetical protein [Proteus]MDK6829326.1 hypothetical protein [Proteus mirabilis]MDK7833325.1 hypothetical protein [Proteus mirabilis]MDK8634677.1 hypothetical protein [Proteus mirabilis]NBN47717.1 hypothetical protein [Proteus sp. G2626]